MEMITVTAIVERGKGNEMPYSIYMAPNERLDYAVYGTGHTVKEAKEDFLSAYEDLRTAYADEGLEFKEAAFEFVFDLASFLEFYAYVLSLSGLEKVTGVNQRQLSHYINGTSKPRPKTVKKIQESVQAFGRVLSEIQLLV